MRTLVLFAVAVGIAAADLPSTSYGVPNGGAGASNGASGSGFGASGSGFGASGNGFGASGNGFGASGSGFGASGNGLGASGSGFGASGNGFGASGSGFGASGNGFGASGSGLGASGNGFGASGNGFGASGNGFGAAGNGFGGPSNGYGYGQDDEVAALAESIPGGGVPGEDYPILASVPDTGFSCDAQAVQGYYADTAAEAGCQVFHICQDRALRRQQDSFLCPNGTIFNQQYLVCDWWFNVDCSQAESFYSVNELIGVVPNAGYAYAAATNGLSLNGNGRNGNGNGRNGNGRNGNGGNNGNQYGAPAAPSNSYGSSF